MEQIQTCEQQVSANARRQARFCQRQAQEGKKRYHFWLTQDQLVAVRAVLTSKPAAPPPAIKNIDGLAVNANGLLVRNTGKRLSQPIVRLNQSANPPRVQCRFQFDQSLVDHFKEQRFHWEKTTKVWERIPDEATGDADNLLVATAYRLLQMAYEVMMPNKALQQRVIDASFEPIKARTISVQCGDKYEPRFVVRWAPDDLDFRATVRSWPTAWYEPAKGRAFLASEYFDLVLDCADRLGFFLFPDAQQLAKSAQSRFQSACTVAPRRNKGSLPTRILPTTVTEIDPTLRDDACSIPLPS